MKNYQVRFMNEYNELVNRYRKLNSLLNKYELGALDFELNCPIELLQKQSAIMYDYICILYERDKYEKVGLEKVLEGDSND